eukprot:Clim_evm2s42 gene=Clim_evmTU2s42
MASSSSGTGTRLRALLAIDGEYLNHGLKQEGFSSDHDIFNFDYDSLFSAIGQALNVDLYEKWYFTAHHNGVQARQIQQRLHRKLMSFDGAHLRIDLSDMKQRTVRCYCHNQTHTVNMQKGVDVRLALRVHKHLIQRQCDAVVLLAGDGDFTEVIKIASDEYAVPVAVAGFRNSLSTDLQSVSARVIWLESLIEWCGNRKKRYKGPLPIPKVKPLHHLLPRTHPLGTVQRNSLRESMEDLSVGSSDSSSESASRARTNPTKIDKDDDEDIEIIVIDDSSDEETGDENMDVDEQKQQQLNGGDGVRNRWTCSKCTFTNRSVQKCEMCRTPKDKTNVIKGHNLRERNDRGRPQEKRRLFDSSDDEDGSSDDSEPMWVRALEDKKEDHNDISFNADGSIAL